jgi:hypothetical protein
MNVTRAMTLATLVAILSATGVAYAAKDAVPVAPAPAAAAPKTAAVVTDIKKADAPKKMKHHAKKHHGKKHIKPA